MGEVGLLLGGRSFGWVWWLVWGFLVSVRGGVDVCFCDWL